LSSQKVEIRIYCPDKTLQFCHVFLFLLGNVLAGPVKHIAGSLPGGPVAVVGVASGSAVVSHPEMGGKGTAVIAIAVFGINSVLCLCRYIFTISS